MQASVIARPTVLAAAAATGLIVGGALSWLGRGDAGDLVWFAGTAIVATAEAGTTLRALLRGRLGVDIIALLAMVSALAMGELFAGALVAVMMSGGAALEQWASAKARRDLSLLAARAPRVAHVISDGEILEMPVEAVAPGNVVLVRAGEVVPVDGLVDDDAAVLDESALTGEALPVSRPRGDAVRSGVANVGGAFRLRATSSAAESTYAGIVRLVERAQERRAPFARMADRYALLLLLVTVGLAGLAWTASGDSVRALAVLVVATPCPLILAAPVALVAGVSRAARRGVIVKGAEVIERLGSVRTVLFDKTGTLTRGDAEIVRVEAFGPVVADEILRLAASLDQVSGHALAEAIVHRAQERGVRLATPTGVTEEPGSGISGNVDGREVALGQPEWLALRGVVDARASDSRAPDEPGHAHVMVAVDGRAAGLIVLADGLRDDAAQVLARLRSGGVDQIWLVTGDQVEVAESIGRAVGVDRIISGRAPGEKLDVVREAREGGMGAVMMVGDGINDAPALAAADVGMALGAGGATVASDTADAVVMVDRLERVADAVTIGRRSLTIARQSVLVGMLLSLVAMVAAALGHIPPAAGAILQEGIDLAVIANALRALTD